MLRGRIPVALLGVLGTVFAGCSAMTSTRGGAPTHPCSAKSAVRACLLAPACIPPALKGLAARPAPPTQLSTPLEARLLSRYAIFRRPTASRGEAPPSKSLRGELRRSLYEDYELSSYYPGYVRQLSSLPRGRRYFIVPAFGRRETVPPNRCFPPGLRPELVAQQRRRMTEPVYCLVAVGGGRPKAAPGCEPFAAIDEGGVVFKSVPVVRQPIVELVPDGVASVRISYRSTAPQVVPVSENAFLFEPPVPTPKLEAELARVAKARLASAHRRRLEAHYKREVTKAEPIKVEWLDARGRTIKTVSAPPSGRISPTSVGSLRAPIGG